MRKGDPTKIFLLAPLLAIATYIALANFVSLDNWKYFLVTLALTSIISIPAWWFVKISKSDARTFPSVVFFSLLEKHIALWLFFNSFFSILFLLATLVTLKDLTTGPKFYEGTCTILNRQIDFNAIKIGTKRLTIPQRLYKTPCVNQNKIFYLENLQIVIDIE